MPGGSVDVGEAVGHFSFKKLFAFMGPGFLISIAYIDPGNIDADIASGAHYEYQLIWVLLSATIMGLILQFFAAKLGVLTQRDLAQHCRLSYQKPMRYSLWIMAEISVIASDIPEVLGTAFALKLLFGIPLWLGVLITGLDTLLFLFLQNFSIRALEVVIGIFLFVISACFVVEMFLVDIELVDMAMGFIPFDGFIAETDKSGYTVAAISLVGAVVMPHNLYLHSALVQSRKVGRDKRSVTEAMVYNLLECSMALGVSFLINLAIITVAASTFFGQTLYAVPESQVTSSMEPIEPGLNNASLLLQNVLHSRYANFFFALALLASGQSSTITGTYAGQFVMEGFLEWKVAAWKRNLITRSVAIVPSLLVALLAGDSGSDTMIILSQVLLSIQLPFALIPLVKLTNSARTMGEYANQKLAMIVGWILAVMVIAANLVLVIFVAGEYLDWTQWWGWIGLLVCGTIGFAYLAFLAYLSILPIDKMQTCFDFERDASFNVVEELSDDDTVGETDELADEEDDMVSLELGDGVEMKVLSMTATEEIPSRGEVSETDSDVVPIDQLPATADSNASFRHSGISDSE